MAAPDPSKALDAALLDLPNEILLQVANELDIVDLGNFRLANARLGDLGLATVEGQLKAGLMEPMLHLSISALSLKRFSALSRSRLQPYCFTIMAIIDDRVMDHPTDSQAILRSLEAAESFQQSRRIYLDCFSWRHHLVENKWGNCL